MTARPAGLPGLLALAALAAASGQAPSGPPDADDGSFGMSPPVACMEVKGFENFVPLPGAALTADEKLLVYYRPLHYKSTRVGAKYEAHLTQDGRIRRRGEKAVLWAKKDMVDYKVRTDEPPRLIYIRNTVSLKGLKPGEYDFDVVLHDKVGQSAPAVRTLPFRVIAAPAAKEKEGDGG